MVVCHDHSTKWVENGEIKVLIPGLSAGLVHLKKGKHAKQVQSAKSTLFPVRTHWERYAWRLAGWQVHGKNEILTNNRARIQAAAQTPTPLSASSRRSRATFCP
jgi:hypothetical protein